MRTPCARRTVRRAILDALTGEKGERAQCSFNRWVTSASRADKLEDWSAFATGLARHAACRSSAAIALALRMDDRKQRFIVDRDGGDGAAFYGWEVADAAALDALAARLEKRRRRRRARLARARGRALRDGSDRRSTIRSATGSRPSTAPSSPPMPFRPGRSISGFRTGPLGMGHVVLTVDNIDDAAAVLSGRARLSR